VNLLWIFHQVIDTVMTNCCYRVREITGPPSATSSLGVESRSTREFALPIGFGKRGCRRQTDDLITAQCFEKRLNAAADKAPHPTAVDLHLADS
jgi:hypothetical protein